MDAPRREPTPRNKRFGPGGKPLGRPPTTDSAETRRRVLLTARHVFSMNGYDGTTNKELADAAELSPSALYYYFQFKHELYAEVFIEIQHTILEAYATAIAGVETLRGKLDAILDIAADVHEKDPTLAPFVSVAPFEIRRHPEIRAALGAETSALYRFVERMVEEGMEELPPGTDAAGAANMIVAMLGGLGQVAATSRGRSYFRAATATMRQMINGQLFVLRTDA
jgi:AcrR family transcriptional regulator